MFTVCLAPTSIAYTNSKIERIIQNRYYQQHQLVPPLQELSMPHKTLATVHFKTKTTQRNGYKLSDFLYFNLITEDFVSSRQKQSKHKADRTQAARISSLEQKR